jgi:hypothetical protein
MEVYKRERERERERGVKAAQIEQRARETGLTRDAIFAQ